MLCHEAQECTALQELHVAALLVFLPFRVEAVGAALVERDVTDLHVVLPLCCVSAHCCLICVMQPFEYLGTAVSTGVMFMALAWVLFDVDDEPPSGGGLSPPRR